MITVHTTREDSQQYDADQGVVEQDGTLKLYRFQRIGPYKCPLSKEAIIDFAAGKWSSFTHD